MSAQRENLTIEKGGTFTQTFVWKDLDGVVVPNGDYTPRMHIRESVGASTTLLELGGDEITLGGANGEVTITLSAAVTAAIDWNEAYYDLELVNGAVVEKFVKGRIFAVNEVTR